MPADSLSRAVVAQGGGTSFIDKSATKGRQQGVLSQPIVSSISVYSRKISSKTWK